MSYYAKPIANLIEEFAKLPGIGPKTAQRIAFYIINMPKDSVNRFAETLLEARGKIRYCSVCVILQMKTRAKYAPQGKEMLLQSVL